MLTGHNSLLPRADQKSQVSVTNSSHRVILGRQVPRSEVQQGLGYVLACAWTLEVIDDLPSGQRGGDQKKVTVLGQ